MPSNVVVPMPTYEQNFKKTKPSACGLVILIFGLPFIILDLYVALTDASCVDQSITRMSITLKTWLFVASGTNLFTIIWIIANFIFLRYKDLKTYPGLTGINKSISIFSACWYIVGAVLFWGYMDFNSCSSMTKDYVFARLIIGLLFSSCSICSKKKDK